MELSDYEINSQTLVIVPKDRNTTYVYEIEDEFLVHKSCFSIIKDSCLFFGSSYEGRIEGTKSMLGCKMKLPIIIEEANNLIFFPTASVKNMNCVWISYKNLLKYTKNSNFSTVLFFNNNKTIEIGVKYNIVDNQIIRCIKLESLWEKRKNDFK